MRTRRIFTRDFKLSILRELESKSAAEICREHNLHPVLLCTWKRDYERNPNSAFSGRGNMWKEEAKIIQYERLIGQLYAENAFLKKTSAILQQRKVEEKKRWSK
jgi:transposase-like protein